MESFDPVSRDGKRRERKEGSGEVRSAVEMLLADGEEVMDAGEMFPSQAGGRRELRLLLGESFLLYQSCGFHWYRQISPQNAGRKGSLTSITAALPLPGFAAACGVCF